MEQPIGGSAEKLWIKSEPLESGFTENFPMKREYDVEPFTDTTCFTTQETICKSEFICDDDGGYEAPPSSVNVGIKSGEKRKRRSDDNAPFKCKECGKEFTLRASYGRHIQGHSNFKPYACHTCGMRFGQKAHALTHQRTHTTIIKQWKTQGPEQELLEKMFEEGSIEEWEIPVVVQSREPRFHPFSERVFASHFRRTKSKMGYGNAPVREKKSDHVPELDVPDPNAQCRSTVSSPNQETAHPITHINPPGWTWVYTNNEKKKDFVCVVVPELSGKSAITISEDGLQIVVKFDWPKLMFKPNKLFSKSIASNGRKLCMNHPKVHSFVSHLRQNGVTENSTLQSDIVINLPQRVLRKNGTWTKEKVVVSDTKMILLEFSAFQNSVIN